MAPYCERMTEEISPTAASDPRLSADRPLEDPSDDRLGYSGFARNLAEGLVGMAPRGRFVIALYGGWGTGKTTVLNFMRYYIEQDTRIQLGPDSLGIQSPPSSSVAALAGLPQPSVKSTKHDRWMQSRRRRTAGHAGIHSVPVTGSSATLRGRFE